MKRRTLLATAGSVLLATAGCTTDSDAAELAFDDVEGEVEPGGDAVQSAPAWAALLNTS